MVGRESSRSGIRHRIAAVVTFRDGHVAEVEMDLADLLEGVLQVYPRGGDSPLRFNPDTVKHLVADEPAGAPRPQANARRLRVKLADGNTIPTASDDAFAARGGSLALRTWDRRARRAVRVLVPIEFVSAILTDDQEVAAAATTGVGRDVDLTKLALNYQRRLAEIRDPQLMSNDVGSFESAVRLHVNRLLKIDGRCLPELDQTRLSDIIVRNALGFGPLDALLRDAAVTEIMVNGHTDVYIERDGRLERTGIRFEDEAALVNIIRRMVGLVGRRIDEANPMVDARLPDGSRVNAVIPPASVNGPVLTIRKFRSTISRPGHLVAQGTLNESMAMFLAAAVRGRLNILISGGTGSGKTTTLNALASQAGERERIISIEDAVELQIDHPHVVALECRPPNVEGRGELTTRQLLRNSLRMRPDRLVIGEVRGAEALDMLQAMNTGHDGTMSTVHANSARDALFRVETMVVAASGDLPLAAVRQQMVTAIDLVIHQARLVDGTRRVVQVAEVVAGEQGGPVLRDIYLLRRGRHEATGAVPACLDKAEFHGVHVSADLFRPGWSPVELRVAEAMSVLRHRIPVSDRSLDIEAQSA